MNSKTAALLRKYENAPGELIESVNGLSDAELNKRLAPKKWSIRQQVHHLADAEVNFVQRMKKIIAEENPLITPFDQDKWAAKFSYDKSPVEGSVALFYTLRASMVPVLKKLSDKDFMRTGVHAENGKVTLFDILEHAVEHTEHHFKMIEKSKKKI
ncbi:MAG: DinB family protein [Bacteroidetes bacterium]|nr:DinB family protein [Bacteroidota bacterium]MCL5739099.1 DinB family protein [Bacteroidota bacterium]